MAGNEDLVDALTKFNNGRGLSSFIQKNSFVLFQNTTSQNLIFGIFGADVGIVEDALLQPKTYDKNFKLYHYIQQVGTPQKYIEALEGSGNERMLEMIREILDKAGLLGAGGATGRIPGGSGNESRGSSSGGRIDSPDSKSVRTTTTTIAHLDQSQPASSSGFDDGLFSEKKTASYDCKNVRVLFTRTLL